MLDPAIYRTKAWEYSEEVLSEGEKNVRFCKWIKLAAERFQNDLKRSDLTYDLEAVEMITIWFEETLYVPELKKPSPLPLPAAFWFQQLYGFKYKNSGLRRFTEMLLEMSRKNAKTFFAAGISDFELIAGNDDYPMIMQGANSRDQALICTDMSGKLVKSSPELRSMLDGGMIDIFTYRKKTTEIVYEVDGRSGRVVAMPKDPGDGGNPSVSVIDEFHEAVDLQLLETMKSGQGARREPMNIVISSPGHNKQGPLYTVIREKATKMLRGIIEDDRNLAFIYEQDTEEDWDKEEMIEKSNPMVPYFPTLRPYVKDRIKEAKRVGGATMVNVKIKNSGVWVDSAVVWIPDEDIKANSHGVKVEELTGKECYMGIDLSRSKDLTAIGYLIPNVRPDVHAFTVQFHIPEAKIDSNEDAVDYRKWADNNWVIVHEGNVLSPKKIYNDMFEEMQKYQIKGIGFDQRFAYPTVATQLAENGYEEVLTPIGQGYALATAVNETETILLTHKFELFDNPIMRWNFANVVMKEGDQGHRYPSKSKSANKIDGVTALLTAWTEYNHRKAEPPKESGIDFWN